MGDVVAGLAVFGVVIAVGWLLVRTRAVPADADGVLTRVCFFAATPALLVTTLSRADLTAVVSRTTAVAVAAELVAIVSAWCLHRLVLRRSTAEATIGALASGYVNAANLGIPVAVLVLGDAATIAPILLLQLLVLTPVTFTVLVASPTTTASPGMTASFQPTASHRPLRRPAPRTDASGSGLRRGRGAPARLMPSASIMSGTATRPSISRPWAG